MAPSPDFDFKIGRSHFRGSGGRALVALALVRWRLPALILSFGVAVVHWALPWVWIFLGLHLN